MQRLGASLESTSDTYASPTPDREQRRKMLPGVQITHHCNVEALFLATQGAGWHVLTI